MADGATLWRLSVAPTAPKLDLPQGQHQLIEWGGALRWVVSHEAPARLMALAADARGHASVYRSAHDHPGVPQPLTEASLRIHRAIKRAFDPAGLFNRQRLLPEL